MGKRWNVQRFRGAPSCAGAPGIAWRRTASCLGGDHSASQRLLKDVERCWKWTNMIQICQTWSNYQPEWSGPTLRRRLKKIFIRVNKNTTFRQLKSVKSDVWTQSSKFKDVLGRIEMGYPSPYRGLSSFSPVSSGEYHVVLCYHFWTKPVCCFLDVYPLANVYITMENHHFQWVNPLFQWPFSIATLNYQRVLLIAGGYTILLLLSWISYPYYNPFTVVASNWLHRLSGSAICWRDLCRLGTAGISTLLDDHLHLDPASTHNGVNKIPKSLIMVYCHVLRHISRYLEGLGIGYFIIIPLYRHYKKSLFSMLSQIYPIVSPVNVQHYIIIYPPEN